MKKIKNLRHSFILLLVAVTVTIACQKAEISNVTDAAENEVLLLTTAADAEADVFYSDVFDNVMGINDEVGIGGRTGVFGRSSLPNTATRFEGTDSTARCFTVSISPTAAGVFPKRVVVDFGTGCTGRDGHTRRGKVITEFTGRMVVPGSKAVTVFDGYYFDSVKVEGTHTIENTSTSNHRIFTVKVVNGKLTRPSGNYLAWNETKTREQVEGNGTPNFIADDIFSITGEASGTLKYNDKTVQWTSAITEPVIRKFTCRWPVKGQIKVTRNTRTVILDYGNGTCDDQATLSINGNVQSITLR